MGTTRHTPAPKPTKTAAKAAPASKSSSKERDPKHDKPSNKSVVAAPLKGKEKDKDKAHVDKHDHKHDKHVHEEPAPKSKSAEKDKPSREREEPLTIPKIAAAPVSTEEVVRPSITTTMNKSQLARFRKLLEEKRDDIIKKAKQTLDEDMTLDANDLPDEMDLASSEYLQSFTFRLRGREKSFLDKIEKALGRIDDGTFGVCEECAEEISVKRLEARPETTLCIRCKEDQERAEKDYG